MEDQDRIRDEQRFVLDEIRKDRNTLSAVRRVEEFIEEELHGAPLHDNDAKTLFEAALIRWMKS